MTNKIIKEYRATKPRRPSRDHAAILNKLSQTDINDTATRIISRKTSIADEARKINTSPEKLTLHLQKHHNGYREFINQKYYQHANNRNFVKRNFMEDAQEIKEGKIWDAVKQVPPVKTFRQVRFNVYKVFKHGANEINKATRNFQDTQNKTLEKYRRHASRLGDTKKILRGEKPSRAAQRALDNIDVKLSKKVELAKRKMNRRQDQANRQWTPENPNFSKYMGNHLTKRTRAWRMGRPIREDAVPVNAIGAPIAGANPPTDLSLAPRLALMARREINVAKEILRKRKK